MSADERRDQKGRLRFGLGEIFLRRRGEVLGTSRVPTSFDEGLGVSVCVGRYVKMAESVRCRGAEVPNGLASRLPVASGEDDDPLGWAIDDIQGGSLDLARGSIEFIEKEDPKDPRDQRSLARAEPGEFRRVDDQNLALEKESRSQIDALASAEDKPFHAFLRLEVERFAIGQDSGGFP